MTTAKHRPLSTIALEIRADWKKPSVHAVPYLDAMLTLDQIGDDYYADTAESVVLYFLSNASGWRGETARKIKAELNQLLETAND